MNTMVELQFIAKGNDGKTYTNMDLGGCYETYYIIPTKQQIIEDMEETLYYLQEDTPEGVVFTECECRIIKGKNLLVDSGLKKSYRLEAIVDDNPLI